jgi:hypothetical protein
LWDTNFDVGIRLAATYWISNCPAAKLAIELTGGGHNYRLGQMGDKSRSNVLADQEVIVLRFWNHQVRYGLDSVLKSIWFALEKRLLSQPSPQSFPFRRERRTLYGDDAISVAGPAKCEKTAQAVTSKSQTPNPKNPSSDHGSFRHCIFIDVSALSALCVVHPVLDFDD